MAPKTIKKIRFHYYKTIRWKWLWLPILGFFIFFSQNVSQILADPAKFEAQPSSLGLYASFQPEGDIRRFVGEILYFDISFLWFENAASANVGLYEKNETLYAYLDAQTKGFVGFFTAYRRHTYKTIFEVIDNGKRLRAKQFIRKVIEGGKVETSDHTFNYETREHKWSEYVNKDLVEIGKEEIPEGVNFDDVLTAFYNFRNSVYGKVEKGRKYIIKTVPEKGHDEISVYIHTQEEENEIRKEEGRPPADEYLFDIIVPKEIFKSSTGILRFWASKHLIPLESIVRDYILLGDLHAMFRKRVYQKPAVSAGIPASPVSSVRENPQPSNIE